MSSPSTPENRLELQAPPLRPRLSGCPVWNGRGRTPVGFWLLEKQIHWYGVHFIDDRARPCLAAAGSCRPCAEGWLPRRVGYICAMHAQTGGRYLLRISEYAYRQCPVLSLRGVNFAGQPVLMFRLGDRKNAPWRIEVPAVEKVPPLPPPVDVTHVLSLLWGIDLRRVAACPPPDGDLAGELRPFRRQNRRQA